MTISVHPSHLTAAVQEPVREQNLRGWLHRLTRDSRAAQMLASEKASSATPQHPLLLDMHAALTAHSQLTQWQPFTVSQK